MEEKINKKLNTLICIVIIWFIIVISILLYIEYELVDFWSSLIVGLSEQWFANADWFDGILDYLKYWI